MDVYGAWRNLPAIYALQGTSLDARDHRRQRPHAARQSRGRRGARSCARRTATLRARSRSARIRGQPVAFLARHGYGHTIPPHKVNYRANLWALAQHEVKYIVAVARSAAYAPDLKPGTLAVPDQIIDYTYGREFTYFDGDDRSVVHVDFTQPYCEAAAPAAAAGRARRRASRCSTGGTYAATQGPRLESAAEIDRLERDGADMVGMTGMPEAALARELGPLLRGDRGGRELRRGARATARRASSWRTSTRSRARRSRACTRSSTAW